MSLRAVVLLIVTLVAVSAHAAAPAKKKAARSAAAATSPAPAPAPPTPSFDEQFKAAQQLAKDGKREEALAAYAALLERSPNNSDVLLARGRLYTWMKRYPEAESDLNGATRASPKYADAWSALGDMYRWSDRPALAATAYGKWRALAPNDPAPHMAVGRALQLAGDASGARGEYEMARMLGAPDAEVNKALDSLRPTSLAPDAVAAAGYRWSANLAGSNTSVSGGGISDYQNMSFLVRRHFETGSLAGEVLRVQRFGKSDTAYALDAYRDLWDRAYTNVRFQVSPDHTLFPQDSGRVEIYQGVGKGWELAASEDWLHFGSTVNILGLAAAKYWSNYYGRLRMTYVDTSGSVGWRLTLRDYYLGDADNYLELFGGTSRGEITSRGETSLQWSRSVGAAWVTFFSPHWGVKVGADYSASDHTENTVSATLYSRW